MSQNSKIEWTDHTFNPWHGCMKVSEGCKNCYAEALDHRWQGGHWGPGSDRKPMSEKYWAQPLKWNAAAEKAGIPAKVFCASMADVFEDHPQVVEWRERLFELIRRTPWLIWQLLTKRPENVMKMLPRQWTGSLPFDDFPPNVWIGTTVENQAAAEERIPHLVKIPAAVRFLSCEPLLGPVKIASFKYHYGAIGAICTSCAGKGYYDDNFHTPCSDCECSGRTPLAIHWVIAGGESGYHARPMHPDWVRELRDECKDAGIPFFLKQLGEWRQYDHDAGDNAKPLGMFDNGIFRPGNIIWDGKKGSIHMARMGKKAAGRLLDGVEHNEFPKL